MLSPEDVEDYREILEEYMNDTVQVLRRASQTPSGPTSTGDDEFGGVSPTMGGDTDGDGRVPGATYKCRLTLPRAQFNFAETQESDMVLSRTRMLLVIERDATVAAEEQVLLEDQLLYSSQESGVETLYEVMSVFPNSQGLALHVMVQSTEKVAQA